MSTITDAYADMTMDADGTLHVGPSMVPVPKTISKQAQTALAKAAERLNNAPPRPPAPAVTDKAGWREYVAGTNKMLEPMAVRRLTTAQATFTRETIGGVTVYVGTPKEVIHTDRVRVAIHGGAFVMGSGRAVEADAAVAATESGCKTYAIDYRMPPDHPYPASLDDCLSVYRELLKTHNANKIAMSGISSGGALCASLILKARDTGLPLPAVAGLFTPLTDLTLQGDTWNANMGIDNIVTTRTDRHAALYANGNDLKDPYISPVYGDFTKGFPPTFLQSGTRDILLSDTVRMHQALRKAGVEAQIHVWEAMPHAGFGEDAPEDQEVQAEFLRFADKHMS